MIVKGSITGQDVDTEDWCPQCEHLWTQHVGPVANWARHCGKPTTDLLKDWCQCIVDIRQYPQVLWDQPKPFYAEWNGKSSDPVSHPSHYTSHPSGIECIQITEHMNFCRGNAIKYIWRAGEKGNEIEDLEKARWYLDREVQRLKSSASK